MTQTGRFVPTAHILHLFGFDGLQLLDLAGPAQVFSTATDEGADPPYALRYVGLRAGTVTSASGLPLVVEAPEGLPRAQTLILPGGPGVVPLARDPAAMRVIEGLIAGADRVASVCTGARLLAQSGCLAGRRAVTHWRACAELAADFPAIRVESDPLFIEDGPYWTSAGVTAGIDLALALVERDHGAALAGRVARRLVVYLRRSGGQDQFSEPLRAQLASAEPYQALIERVLANPAADWRAEVMAEACGQSLRSFHRKFPAATGTSPARMVEAIRADLARGLLQSTDLPVEQVALRSGFASAGTMRRALRRHYGVPQGRLAPAARPGG